MLGDARELLDEEPLPAGHTHDQVDVLALGLDAALGLLASQEVLAEGPVGGVGEGVATAISSRRVRVSFASAEQCTNRTGFASPCGKYRRTSAPT